MIYLFGTCELDIALRELRRDGIACAVEPRVFDLLLYLVENRDRMISKEELNERIWEGRIVSDASLSSCIKLVRKAIGDDGRRQKWIRTLPRRGFRFVGRVDVPDITRRTDDAKSAELGFGSTDLPLADKPSIAVLPFVNMSGDPEQECISDGIAEDVITALSRFPYRSTAPRFQSIPGLIRKYYLFDEEAKKGGGCYLFESRAAAEKTFNREWRNRISELYGEPEVQYFDTSVIVDNVAGEIVESN